MTPTPAFGCAHAPLWRTTTLSTPRCPHRPRQSLPLPARATIRASAARSSDSIPVPAVPSPLMPEIDTIWELDFYSRPVVGADGKKLWELVITDANGRLEHVESIPNSLVNSRELRKRIQAVIDDSPVAPLTIRFFRTQMLNMITIALSGIDVQVRPSRRTYALFALIKEREKNVYPTMPGYKPGLNKAPVTFLGVDLTLTEKLPDALRCDKFAFANLPLAQVEEFFAGADDDDFFGDSCLVDGDIPKDAMVPGVIVFSKRSKVLAGWMSGVELAFIQAAMSKQELTLECGLTTRYRFAGIDDTIKPEARAFQNAKEAVGGLHFLAIQKSEDTDDVDGFWLLTESQ